MTFSSLLSIRSHPVRVRGLKPFFVSLIKYYLVAPRAGAWIETNAIGSLINGRIVAPRAGAWIETSSIAINWQSDRKSHPVRVRGLKLQGLCFAELQNMSHPVRVRGLKHNDIPSCTQLFQSHPVRVRGLKL